jgi:hypothetical protein
MPVDTETRVENLSRVEDANGEQVAPSTERSSRKTFERGDAESAETSSEYPIEFDPSVPIYELMIVTVGQDVTVEISTTGGDSFEIPMDGNPATFNRWEIESVSIPYPGTDQQTVAAWAGE